jgi:hypothetical protein
VGDLFQQLELKTSVAVSQFAAMLVEKIWDETDEIQCPSNGLPSDQQAKVTGTNGV